MARKLANKNLIVSLTLLSVGMIVIISVLMLRQLQHRDPDYFLELAQQSERDGNWKSAAALYRKAWEQTDDPSYLLPIGDLLLDAGEVRKAIRTWQSALIDQPDLTEAHIRLLNLRLELARLFDRIDDWKSVHDTAQAFLDSEASKPPLENAIGRNANGLALIRLARLGEGNIQQGESELYTATQLAPDAIEYRLDLAAYYVQQDRLSDGERLYEGMILQHSEPGADAANTRTAYATHLARHQRFDEAARYFEEGLSLGRDAPDALHAARVGYALFLAQSWSAEQTDTAVFERAESLLKSCIEADPDSYEPYLQLAMLYGADGRHSKVVEVCEARLERGLARKGLKAARHRIDAFSLMIFASEACISEGVVAHESADDASRQTWLARADSFIESARAELPDNPRVFTQSARRKLVLGKDREALDDLRAAHEGYQAIGTVNWENTITLARLHLRLNEAGAAKAVLDEVLDQAIRERQGDTRFWILLSRVLFRVHEFDRALGICDELLQREPGNTDATRLKQAIYERQGRTEEADRLAAQVTNDPVVRKLLEARRFVLEDNSPAALDVVLDALRSSPADVRLVGSAVRLLLDMGRAAEARDYVQRALNVDRDDTRLQMWLLLTKEDLSSEVRDEAILRIIQEEGDDYQRMLDLIGFYLAKKEYETVLPLLDEAIGHLTAGQTRAAQRATSGQHRTLLETKLTVASGLGELTAMDDARDQAARFNVDGAGGKFIEGLYEMHRQDYEAANEAFREVLDAQPTNARALAYLGRCLQISRRPEEARVFYDRAILANPDEGMAHKGLAMLAKASGDTDAYERALRRARGIIPNDAWVASEILEQEEKVDPHAAIRRREEHQSANPNDVPNLIRLAKLYASTGDRAGAGESYLRALQLQPDNRGLVASVADFFRTANRPDQAFEIVTQFAESRPDTTDKARSLLLVAAHHLHVGDNAAVESTLLAAVALTETSEIVQGLAEFYLRSDNRPDKALPWFDRAIDLARESLSPNVPRLLAERIRCLLSRTLNDIEMARKYTDDLLTNFPEYPQGLLLLSEIQSRTGDMDGAIATISDYLRHEPNDPNALFHRALHHLARGRVAPAVQDLEAIKRTDPLALDLEPRLLLARLKQQTGRNDVALRELESLTHDAPGSIRALEALVTAYLDENKLFDADRMITARINQARNDPQPQLLYLRGRVAFQLGDYDRALGDVKYGAELSQHDHAAILQVLDMFLQTRRAGEGVDYYQQFAPANPTSFTLVSRHARLLVAAGRIRDGLQQFQVAMAMAIAQSPLAVGAVSADLGEAFPDQSSVNDALQRVQRDRPEGPAARASDRLLTRLYWMASRVDDAARAMNDLINTSQDNRERALLLHELGFLHQSANRANDARLAYQKALEFSGDSWVTLNNLAYILSEDLHESELARPFAERAVAAADNPDTRDTLGWILVGLEDYAHAIAELSQTIRQGSTDPLHYYHLGEAYRRAGRFGEGASILQMGRTGARQAGDDNLVRLFDTSIEKNGKSNSSP